MLDKNDILAVLQKECDIAKHLYEKLPEGALEYRPSPGQRSTLELLRYLSFCGIAGARTMAEGNWDTYKALAERSATLTAEEFPAAMDRQKDELAALFEGISEEDFETRTATEPAGQEVKLIRAMLDIPLRWMTGYRMQLFLYAKAAGNEEIWTPNCWEGIDWEKPAPDASSE